jgi:hypothetical protein
MGFQNWKHIAFNYFKTVPSCSIKGDVYGKREKSSLPKAVMWRLPEARTYSVYRWLKDITLKSLPPFTFPTRIQLAVDSIMRLIWCGYKTEIP